MNIYRGAAIILAAGAIAAPLLMRASADALPAGTAPTHVLSISPASGDSGTSFNLVFDTAVGADRSCRSGGDLGYRWHSFMTPLSNDPAPLTFPGDGSPVGPNFTAALRDSGGVIVRAQSPSIGDGTISLSGTTFSFVSPQFSVANPAFGYGSYNVGVACTYGGGDPGNPGAGSAETIEYWSTVMTLTAQPGAGPHGYVWQYVPPVGTSTTTTTTTTTAAATTTTIAGATTSTTAAGGSSSTSTSTPDGSTTSTVAGGVTTTTVLGSGTPTTLFGSGGSGSFNATPTQTIANAGSNTGPMLLVAALLLIGGRMVILAARRTKVVPHGDR